MSRIEVKCLLAVTLVFIFSSTNFSFVRATKQCSITQDVADETTKKISFFGDRDAVFPLKESEIADYCKMIFSSVKTLTEYSRCLKPFPKTIIRITMEAYKKITKKRCVDKNWKKSFIKLGTCVKEKNLSENFHLCTDKGIVAFEYIVQRLPLKDHILMACCVGVLMKICVLEQGIPCGQNSSEFAFQLFNEVTADTFDLVCSSYKSIEICNEKFGVYMKTIIKYLKIPRKPTKTFMAASMKAVIGDDFLV